MLGVWGGTIRTYVRCLGGGDNTEMFKTVLKIYYSIAILFCRDKIGKEIISRFTTNLRSNKTFYTDANGREVLKRV